MARHNNYLFLLAWSLLNLSPLLLSFQYHWPLQSLKFRNRRLDSPSSTSSYCFSIPSLLPFHSSAMKCVSRKSALQATTSSSQFPIVDITPNSDGGVLKRLIQRGDILKGFPLANDTVEIGWKIFAANGSMVHTSTSLDSEFSFVLGSKPSEVIPGWELAVSQMYNGEISHLTLRSDYAFGTTGAPPLGIGPNDDITCELEILDIIPSIYRTYKRLGPNESIKDDLLKQMQSDSSIFSSSVIANRPTQPESTPSSTTTSSKVTDQAETETESEAGVEGEKAIADKDRKYFDDKKHKMDPNLRVAGEGMNPAPHSWEETFTTMEVEIPLFRPLQKSDVEVSIKPHRVSVKLNSGDEIFGGPLQGKVLASESAWAIFDGTDSAAGARTKGPRITLSLEKSYESRDIWATVISKEHLLQIYGVSIMDDDDYDDDDDDDDN